MRTLFCTIVLACLLISVARAQTSTNATVTTAAASTAAVTTAAATGSSTGSATVSTSTSSQGGNGAGWLKPEVSLLTLFGALVAVLV